MGGNYPWDDWTEFNFNCGDNFMGEPRECFGTAELAVNLMPPEVKMVFLGFEVGADVYSGGALSSCAGADSPCRQAYIDWVGYGNSRSSWDPMTLVAAVRGGEGIGCEETGQGGRNEVNQWGGNYWVTDVEGGSNQTYLKLNVGLLK